jgi:hypothetical protein
MRKDSILAGLMLIALASAARADDSAPAAAVTAPQRTRREASLTLLPMAAGRFTASPGGMTMKSDAAFASGVGLSVSYVLVPGLSVGFAPQAILNVKAKEDSGDAAIQVDLMARIAYTRPVVETIALYAEVLPGYSLILPSNGDTAKGLVVGFGVGSVMDLSERVFALLGVGYQVGFQKLPAADSNAEVSTKYVRVALGGGVRF